MRLSVYSDYSLRLLMYAALHPAELVTIQQVAEAYGISRNHLMKVAFELGRHGFLETVRGRKGGLRLARPPRQIGLGEVVRKTEEGFVLVECFDAAADRCALSGPCRLKGALSRALKAYLAVLDEYTLADLTRNRAELRALLPA
jgi:Rrf2 family transcriptional regulator, nitric oxide-sensitive transcriptional repressor